MTRCIPAFALILVWVPAVTHVDRLPFVISLGALAVITVSVHFGV